MENFIDTMSKEIYKAIEFYLANAPFDRTVAGQVISRESGGKYLVKLNGEERRLVLPSAAADVQPWDWVMVTAPSGDLSQRYISNIIRKNT